MGWLGNLAKKGAFGGLLGAARGAGVSDDVLGSLSPVYGAVTGRGLMGKGMAAMEDIGIGGGVMTKMAQAARDKRRREMQSGAMPYKKGGKIESEPTGGKSRNKAKRYSKGGSTASKRADGCATKGKTKGRFV